MDSTHLEALINDLENEHEKDADEVLDQLVILLYDLRSIELTEHNNEVHRARTLDKLNSIFRTKEFRRLYDILKLMKRIKHSI